MRGFQLWINLPAREKMTQPKYQEFDPDKIPITTPAAGVRVKVIAGRVGDVSGPISQPATDPTYLDVELDAGAQFTHSLPQEHTAFIYVYEGSVRIGSTTVDAHQLAVLTPGERVEIAARDRAARAILVAGQPLREPIARYGPFVMNTRQEVLQAFADFQAGRF